MVARSFGGEFKEPVAFKVIGKDVPTAITNSPTATEYLQHPLPLTRRGMLG